MYSYQMSYFDSKYLIIQINEIKVLNSWVLETAIQHIFADLNGYVNYKEFT